MQDMIKQRLRMVNAAGIAVITLLAAGTVAFGVMPMFKDGTRNIADASRLQTQLAALDGLSRTLTSVEGELEQTQDRLLRTEKRLPSSSETNTFIKELARVTQAAGIQVDSTNYPRDLKDSGGYKSLPVEIVGTGSWESCYKFLTGLRAMDRLTRLDSVILETEKDTKNPNPDRPVCRIKVNFSTFFMAR